MQAGHLRHKSKSQPGSGRFTCQPGIQLNEWLEQSFQILLLDANAGFGLGGVGGLGDMENGYFPPFGGWVARPIWVMPTRPNTSSTSMTP